MLGNIITKNLKTSSDESAKQRVCPTKITETKPAANQSSLADVGYDETCTVKKSLDLRRSW